MKTISVDEYNAIDAIRNSTLKYIHDDNGGSPRLYKYRSGISESSSALDFGTAIHTKILEPQKFDDQVAVFTGKARRGKAWDEFLSENASKIILTEAEHDLIIGMAESFQENRFTRKLLDQAKVEQSCIWDDPITGLKCKARLDIVTGGSLYDVKSTSDLSKVHYAAKDYDYRQQAGMYSEGYEQVTGEKPESFVFIFIEKKPPFEIKVLISTERLIEYGRRRFRKAIDRVAKCIESGEWPGDDTIGTLDIFDYEAGIDL